MNKVKVLVIILQMKSLIYYIKKETWKNRKNKRKKNNLLFYLKNCKFKENQYKWIFNQNRKLFYFHVNRFLYL